LYSENLTSQKYSDTGSDDLKIELFLFLKLIENPEEE